MTRKTRKRKRTTVSLCGKISRVIGIVVTTIQQTMELSLLVVWGLVMWMPLDIFKRDIKSTQSLLLISATYMFCLFLPALALFKIISGTFGVLESLGSSAATEETRRLVCNVFTFTCVGFMFFVVSLTLWINRKTSDLLLNAEPRSHVR